jgi:hypothetical protein
MNVVIMGGLGNKLFQIAYAHELVGTFCPKKVKLFHAARLKPYRDLLISPLLENCSHLDFRGESLYFYRLDNLLARIFKSKNLVRYLLNLLRFFSEDYCEKPLKRSFVYKGYFQNFEFSNSTIAIMQDEIAKVLEKTSVTVPSSSYTVVHLRRGDYAPGVQGLLAFDYYRNILKSCQVRELLVFSDDPVCAQNFVEFVGFGTAMNPEDVDEWDLLQYFRYADLVITANSSLSWWGGLLCVGNGGKVVVPSPWFRNLEDFKIFRPSGFEIRKSIWL